MSGASTVNILIVDDNDKTRAKLVDQLRYADIRIVGESSFGAAASSWSSYLGVDVVIVAIDEPIARALKTVELLTTGTPSWPVIAVSTLNDRELMRKAMLAGARDYMILPAPGDDLRKSVIRVYHREHERRRAAGDHDRRTGFGTIITVFGVKGGIGKTTTAVNVAAGIAQGTKHHVALVDADLQFGDCAVMLDVVPERTIAEAVAEVDPATPHLIDSYLMDHASHLSLLAAPMNPSAADQVTPEDVGKVLRSLAATKDFVIVDTSPQIDAVTALAIDLSSIVLIMVTPEITCVRRTAAALALLQDAGYSQDKIKLLVNRAGKRTEVPNKELVAALGYPIYAEIPDDRGIAQSITNGMPVVMSGKKSPAGRAYLELGRRLAGVPGKQRRGLFGGWRSRRGHDAESAAVPPAPHPVAADNLLDAWAPAIGAAERREPATGDTLSRHLNRSWNGDQQTAPLLRTVAEEGGEHQGGGPMGSASNGRTPISAPISGTVDGALPLDPSVGTRDD
jgi:pilus assembly protein CpaE